MKKTRKSMSAEFVEILRNIEAPAARLRAHPAFDETNNIIVGYTTIEQGVQKVHYHCRHCGIHWSEEGTYVYSNRECPKCGTDSVQNSRYNSRRYNRLYVEETPNGFLAMEYHAYVRFPDESDWYRHTPDMGLQINRVFLFDREVGVMQGYLHNTEIAPNNSKTQRSIESLFYTACDERGVSKERWRELVSEASALVKKQKAEKDERAKNKKPVEDIYRLYRAKPLNHETLFKARPMFVGTTYDRTATGTIIRVWCSLCGKYHDVTNMNQVKTCPHCGYTAPAMYDDCGYSTAAWNRVFCSHILMENTDLPDNDLLIRLVSVHYEVSREAGEAELSLKRTVHEVQRVYLGKRIHVYGDGRSDNLGKKSSAKSLEEKFVSRTRHALQSDEEIRNIIANSCMARSGIAEAWGLVNGYKEIYPVPNLKYAMGWYKNNKLEMIAKANVPELAMYYINHPDELNEGSSLYEILNLSKPVFKIVQQHNLGISNARAYQRLYMTEESMTYEKYRTMLEYELDLSRMIYIQQTHKVSFDKIIAYMNSVYDHQCIVRKAALTEWYDYLIMAKKLSMDLTQKSLMFPASLKKEHDIAVFAYNALKQEVDAKKFAETAAINKEKYEYSRGEFMVVIPQTPEDIIEEATKQHNCLRSYIERVRDGGTTVAFIRRKKAPQTSYVSVEIFEGRLAQVKLAYNKNPDDPNLNEFIAHWCKACNINPRAY